jgi:2-desacetyl-2-hydroxyethyl bacteriochlorophyllide A dehydrogenase
MTETCRRVVFVAPFCTEVISEPCPIPGPEQVLVQTEASAISAGTELLFYRGLVPPDLPVDISIHGLQSAMAYPIAYGYAAAGSVIAVGACVDPSWLHRRVFAFHPHESYFAADPEALHLVPAGLPAAMATLFPNVETAVNLVMDAAPVIGERAVIMGQGIVGLLTLRLLRSFPLASITVVDAYQLRRELAMRWGATAALSPAEYQNEPSDPDFTIEVSGNPQALDTAVRTAGFDSRVVIGSWYGLKTAQLALGGQFHRNRVRLVSSQVSTIAPPHAARWDKRRRAAVAWQLLGQIPAGDLISHRFHLEDAQTAYRLLDRQPETMLQVVFEY